MSLDSYFSQIKTQEYMQHLRVVADFHKGPFRVFIYQILTAPACIGCQNLGGNKTCNFSGFFSRAILVKVGWTS